MTRLQYFLREAVASLKRGGASNAIAVGTIALALFVLGAFLLVTASLDRLMAGWSSAAELSVYLKDDATEENRAAIETALADSRLVERREFVGQAEALQRFRHDFPDLAAAADGVGASAFPASIEARLRAGAMAGDAVTRLARSVARMTGVADVRFDRQWLDRLARLIAVVRGIGLALASALALAAAFTIAAVVRLAMFGRRDEVEIMQLVGAPLSAIRGPFILEGVLLGGAGAVVALAALGVTWAAVAPRIATALGVAQPMLVQFVAPSLVLGLIGGGMLVGCLGGYIATRAAG